jgi:hypothetical protein
MNTDHVSVLEEYIAHLNVSFQKKKLANGEIFYAFDDFSSGIVSIKLIQTENILTGFSIKGLHKEMNELIKLADQTNSLLNIPIVQYMVMDENKMTPQIIAIVKN